MENVKKKGRDEMRYIFGVFLGAFLLISGSISCPSSYAGSTTSQVNDFEALKKVVLEFNDPQATLVVMDDDDTLTMMQCEKDAGPGGCQYLGGPAWYAWQSGLVGSKSPYSVAETRDELFAISALLFAMNKMGYTEDDLAPVLNGLSASGVRLLVLTARGTGNLSATEMQLDGLDVPGSAYGSFLDMIKRNSLLMGEMNSAGLPGPFVPCDIPGAREVAYQQGVMYVAGQDKGVMLKCLLQYYENDDSGNPALPVKNIVFIDDTQENVDDVYNAFKNSTRYKVKALHYNAFDSHKQALTKQDKKGEILRNRAKQRWDAIQSTLSEQLLSPATGK